MARDYSLNADSARSVGSASKYLQENGKYKGVLTRAEAVVSSKKTEGIELTFKALDGREAQYLTLWTHAADGAELYGLKVLNALMTCMSVREIKPVAGTVTKIENGQEVRKPAEIFPALTGKPIGLVLQRCEYLKSDQSIGHRLEILAPFNAESEKTAAEILDRAPEAQQLGRIVAGLSDRVLTKKPQQHAASAPAPATNFIDDDITF